MDKEYVIGCDAGTSGTKAVVTDKSGKILAHAYCPYGIITPKNQWAEQWPDVWLDAVTKTVSEVAKAVDANKIGAICISALYGGTGALCDENMKPIRPSIIWMDRRADKESRYAAESIGEDRLFEISCNNTDSYFGYIKLLWVKNNEPDNWKKIRHILPIHSYIVYKMTGAITTDYCSAGNIGGIYDYKTHSWSNEICSEIGIEMSALPEKLMSPTDIGGVLNSEFSKKLGIPKDTPICVGTVDCIASMLSASMLNEGDNAAVLGTSLNWGFIQRTLPDDKKLISMPYCVCPEEQSYTYGGASTAGALPRWFMTNFMQNESPEAYKSIEDSIVEKGIPAGSEGLIVLPYFMGERTPIWDESASGLIIGLSLLHTKEHIFRAILESTAYSLRHIMESAKKVSGEKLILVGGGSKSTLWQQIFADVTGIPVYTPVKTAEAPLGDAFMAALSCGLVSDYEQIKEWVSFNPPVYPDIQNHEKYNNFYQIYKQLYPTLKDSMNGLKSLANN